MVVDLGRGTGEKMMSSNIVHTPSCRTLWKLFVEIFTVMMRKRGPPTPYAHLSPNVGTCQTRLKPSWAPQAELPGGTGNQHGNYYRFWVKGSKLRMNLPRSLDHGFSQFYKGIIWESLFSGGFRAVDHSGRGSL